MKKNALLMFVIFFLLLIGGTVQAQTPVVYDRDWLDSIASAPNMPDLFRTAYNASTGWRSNGSTGTYDVPAESAVLGFADEATGNHPAFQRLAENLWYTAEGGRFGTPSGFMAFQLADAPVASTVNRPVTIDDMITMVRMETEYGRQIASLDQEWSASPFVINRWGSSGLLELLTEAQVQALGGTPALTPLVQLLPGNTLVWGELASGDLHYGLVMIAQNIYATTCQGGLFVTQRGFRAMQFAEASPGAVISDTTGCNGTYPVLDSQNPRSVAPLSVVPTADVTPLAPAGGKG